MVCWWRFRMLLRIKKPQS
ncbi:hypothetical protein CHUAL_014094 [Chamberlinius hualienensis]